MKYRSYKGLKTEEFYAALGTDTDAAVGKRFGISGIMVAHERRKLGIPPVDKASPREGWLKEYGELGSYAAVARLHGVSRQWVSFVLRRGRLRRAAETPPKAGRKNSKKEEK